MTTPGGRTRAPARLTTPRGPGMGIHPLRNRVAQTSSNQNAFEWSGSSAASSCRLDGCCVPRPTELKAAAAALGETIDRLHAAHGKPILITEFGADAIAGSHAEPPSLWTEEYQAELIGRLIGVASKRPFVTGVHIWAFADFATAQATHRPYSTNYKGVFTRDRRPKLAAHRLKDLWRG